MNKFKTGLISVFTATALFAGNYTVDTTHSNVAFKVKHLMISNVKGEFNDFSGQFAYDEKTHQLLSLKGVIQATSLNTNNEKRDAHLQSKELFNTKRFPLIEFELDSVKHDKAYGNIIIKGVKKHIALNFTDNGSVVDPWGNTRVGLELSGKLNRKDFGISWNQTLESGGVVISDQVKLSIELEGILQK